MITWVSPLEVFGVRQSCCSLVLKQLRVYIVECLKTVVVLIVISTLHHDSGVPGHMAKDLSGTEAVKAVRATLVNRIN